MFLKKQTLLLKSTSFNQQYLKFEEPVRAKPGAALQTPGYFTESLIKWLSHPLPLLTLQHCHRQTVRDSVSSHKIGYITQNGIGSFSKWGYFAYWLSSIGKTLRLQPAQQACFFYNWEFIYSPCCTMPLSEVQDLAAGSQSISHNSLRHSLSPLQVLLTITLNTMWKESKYS